MGPDVGTTMILQKLQYAESSFRRGHVQVEILVTFHMS